MSIEGLSMIEPAYLDIFKRYDEWKEGIAVSSRIVAGAVAFDDIVYGADDITYEDIQRVLSRQKGVTLCPAVVDAIMNIFGRHYIHNGEKGTK
jgi:response regulator RpfG family c-di-GMP phosphodiesterase